MQADQFFDACDPARENLCLYGYADGSWDASAPCEEVRQRGPLAGQGCRGAERLQHDDCTMGS